MNQQQSGNKNNHQMNQQNITDQIPQEIKNNQIYQQFEGLLEKKIYPVIQKKMVQQRNKMQREFMQKIQFRPKMLNGKNKQNMYNLLNLNQQQHDQHKMELMIKQEQEQFKESLLEFKNLRTNCLDLFSHKRMLCRKVLQEKLVRIDEIINEVKLLESLNIKKKKLSKISEKSRSCEDSKSSDSYDKSDDSYYDDTDIQKQNQKNIQTQCP